MDPSGAPPPRLRLGMVGGGRGAFIGDAHRIAARLDDRYVLVAAAPSSDAANAAASGRDLRLEADRVYAEFADMARAEAARGDGIEVVSVVTPNNLHHPVCTAFLAAGIDVICDKPLAVSLDEARDIVDTAAAAGRFVGVTYTYTGYPMVREARALVAAGAVGAVRQVHVEFAIGALSAPVAGDGAGRRAAWRTDPARSGPSFVVADLGTHCFHLTEFVTGLAVTGLAADLCAFVPGRPLEDHANMLLRYANGARGILWVSMVAAGENAGLRLRVYGERGHLAWAQNRPDELQLAPQGEPRRTLVRGGAGLSPAARRATRMIAGLPEGYYEAFATLYRDYADILAARRAGREPDGLALWAPTGADGARGLAFVEAAFASRDSGGGWVTLPAS